MSSHDDDIISILKQDNAQAWTNSCGGCTTAVAQFDSLTEDNLVGLTLEGRKLSRGAADNNKQAYGLLCNTCLSNENKLKEGPAEAVFLVEGRVQRLPKVYLVEATTETEKEEPS